jgi:Holliday junction DNA helicase RuvB
MLYSAMEDFVIDIIAGSGNNASNIRIDLPPFTLVGATTRFGDLTAPLRDRFGIIQTLHYYCIDELSSIIKRTSTIFDFVIDDSATLELAKRSRGTPRIANRLYRRIRDFAQYKNKVIINKEITIFALNKLHIDECGLDYIDRKYLDGLINIFNGGPVGLETLALTISEEAVTLEDVSEPFLLQEGFIVRTSRGRVATDKAYDHLGIKRGGLF